jgi:transcriptional regulator with XRE-family HTH domain
MKLVYVNRPALKQALVAYCLGHGTTIKDIAREIGIPYFTLRNWLNGDAYPKETTFEKLRQWLVRAKLLDRHGNLVIHEINVVHPRLGRKYKHERFTDRRLIM